MHAGDNVLTLSVTNGSQSLTEIQASDPQEIQQHSDNGRLEAGDNLTVGKVSKKVSFILEPELINSSAFTESETSMESRAETSLSGETGLKIPGCWNTWVTWFGLLCTDELDTGLPSSGFQLFFFLLFFWVLH